MKAQISKLSIHILALLLIVGASSCNDFLNVEPKSNWVTESFYKTKSDVELGLTGIYNYLALDQTYGQLISAKFEGGTDELLYNRTNTKWSQALYLHTSATSDIRNVWLHLYKGVDAANVFIQKVPNTPGLTDEERAQYLGEAHFLRALYYFDLVRWWGPVPLRVNPTEDVNANNVAASSLEDVYAQIIKDLEFATNNLMHANELNQPGRATKMAAHGILARVYLTMAGEPLKQDDKYAKAIEQCDVILTDGWHDLNDDYSQVFLNYIQNQYDLKESMFEAEFSNMRDQGIREDGRIGQINGVQFYYWPTKTEPFAYAMLQASVKMRYAYADGDERFEWNLANFICNKAGKISQITNDLLFWPGKFRRWEVIEFGNIKDGSGSYRLLEAAATPDKNFTGINFPILRFADVLLMRAEAENEVNGPTNAITHLNRVRRRADLGDIDPGLVPDKDAFRKEIQDERLRELCYEGVRKHDLIRWGILGETLQDLNSMIDASNGSSKNKAKFKQAGDNFDPSKHTILPYPIQEVTMNESLDQHTVWQ